MVLVSNRRDLQDAELAVASDAQLSRTQLKQEHRHRCGLQRRSFRLCSLPNSPPWPM